MSTTLINSLPYIISAPGHYKLNISKYIATNAITITCNDVVLDLADKHIVRYSDASNTDKCIYVNSNLTNITIKNGTIRGFFYAIHINDTTYSSKVKIENVTIQNCTFRGIVSTGGYNVIRNCNVSGVQGSTVYPNAFAIGIECTGTALIEDNQVYEIYGTGTGEGVAISSTDQGHGTVIRNNLVINKTYDAHTYLIWVGGSSKAYCLNNTVINAAYAISYSSPTFGAYKDNTCLDCNVDYLISSTNVTSL